MISNNENYKKLWDGASVGAHLETDSEFIKRQTDFCYTSN